MVLPQQLIGHRLAVQGDLGDLRYLTDVRLVGVGDVPEAEDAVPAAREPPVMVSVACISPSRSTTKSARSMEKVTGSDGGTPEVEPPEPSSGQNRPMTTSKTGISDLIARPVAPCGPPR